MFLVLQYHIYKKRSYTTIALYTYLMTSISVVLQKGFSGAFLKGRTFVQGSIVQPVVLEHYSRKTIAENTQSLHRNGGNKSECKKKCNVVLVVSV